MSVESTSTNLTPLQLLVGLGNPGQKYAFTRHNAGVWWLEKLASELNVVFQVKAEFYGRVARIKLEEQFRILLLPDTFMNRSGQSIQAVRQFYRIPLQGILVAHDDLDFLPGVMRLKKGGGHGGHNGLRDIIQHLGAADFCRLRIGIGHPGNRNQVQDYVLGAPSNQDYLQISNAISDSLCLLPALLGGELEKAMQGMQCRKP